MPESRKLVKFEKTAEIFLDFEREYNSGPQETHILFSDELQKDEFKSIWAKVKIWYEDFATNNVDEDLGTYLRNKIEII